MELVAIQYTRGRRSRLVQTFRSSTMDKATSPNDPLRAKCLQSSRPRPRSLPRMQTHHLVHRMTLSGRRPCVATASELDCFFSCRKIAIFYPLTRLSQIAQTPINPKFERDLAVFDLHNSNYLVSSVDLRIFIYDENVVGLLSR